ncbi:MAG TPA: hypothetical protein PLV65_09960, partial [Tenuifilaceae bacterium]|nr:hypothetical protein [Tenuifilaceae bacterium]
MAELVIKSDKIISNVEKLNKILERHNVEWSLVVKVLSGHKEFLKKLLFNPVVKKLHSVGDSRISGLKAIKELNPDIVTMYVKPPPIDTIKSVVAYADISLNSSFRTI